MSFLKKLFGNKGPEDVTKEEIQEAGACPNCWGHSTYGNEYVEYVKDQTKSNINRDKLNQKAFIAQFVETNVTGIRLKKDGDQQFCPSCKTKYKHVSSKIN